MYRCVIYKITSPSNKIYIGQTVNYRIRHKKYLNLNCKQQIRLYNSFLKYGVVNHKFEIIEECKGFELNERERYYQDLYNVIDNNTGLNCKLTKTNDKSGKMSNESKLKMSISATGKKYSEERKAKIKLFLNNSKEVACMITGLKWESATICAKENNINENSLRVKLSGNFKNNTQFIYSETIPIKGVNYLCSDIIKKKKVICELTNKIWDTTKECALENNINRSTLINKLSGHKLNNTTFKYLYEI